MGCIDGIVDKETKSGIDVWWLGLFVNNEVFVLFVIAVEENVRDGGLGLFIVSDGVLDRDVCWESEIGINGDVLGVDDNDKLVTWGLILPVDIYGTAAVL